MNRSSLAVIASVAYKEFLHIYRDRRVLLLLLILPPVFTLIFGHAFESGERKGVPALLINKDDDPRTQRFIDLLLTNETFAWKQEAAGAGSEQDLLRRGVRGALVIPEGWSASLANGEPLPLQFYLDGSDTSTAEQLEGSLQKTLGDFQMNERTELIDSLPDEVIQYGKKLPLEVRNQFVSAMEAWKVEDHVLYNPDERFIDYVLPGVIGIILQLITVTLMACTIARERESGTLYQLMVTSLRRRRNRHRQNPALPRDLGLPGSGHHAAGRLAFPGQIPQPGRAGADLFPVPALFPRPRIAHFGASRARRRRRSSSPSFFCSRSSSFPALSRRSSSSRSAIRWISEFFPLTHFCRAFRLVNLYHATPAFYLPNLLALCAGTVITFVGAGVLLRRIEQ